MYNIIQLGYVENKQNKKIIFNLIKQSLKSDTENEYNFVFYLII